MSRRKKYKWDVFISHRGYLAGWVRQFAEQLEKECGKKVFYAERNLAPGKPFATRLKTELEASRYVVLLVTPDVNKSSWMHMETIAASMTDPDGEEGRLIPVLLETTNIDKINKTAIRFALQTLEYIDLTDPETEHDQYRALLKALGIKHSPLPAPPPRMLSKPFDLVRGRKVLAIGAHWDDILYGCLGTLLKLRSLYGYQVKVIVLCSENPSTYYGVEQENLDKKVQDIYENISKQYSIDVEFGPSGKEGFFDHQFRSNIRDLREWIKVRADGKYKDCNLILTPSTDDKHEDHAITGQLVFSCFRQSYQTVLEYEIKKYTGRWFVPNIFISLDDEIQSGSVNKCIAEIKANLLSGLITRNRATKINGSDFLFGEKPIRAKLRVNALEHSGEEKSTEYGEVFRGRISI
jgi:hypothetical protein